MAKRKTINIERIVDLYDIGYGTNRIAEIERIHRSTVQYSLKKMGIKLRKTSPHNHYDVDFFSKYTKESCYWAGFFLADGHVRSKRDACDLHLSGCDRGHLEKLSKLLKNEGKIEDCKDGSVRITFCGEWFVRDLKKLFGVYPKKSLTCKISENIPDEYYKDFIRGVFDGDGSITIATCPSISFTSSFHVLDFLRFYFSENVGVKLKSKNEQAPIQNRGKFGSIHYSGENAGKILKWMYDNSEESIRLDRKYFKWKELFCAKDEE